ncbi:hypothetical protein SAMN05216271_1716 [Halopseudomonas sabulinigri]|uniref:Uncharacterized protein n=1 Tax=Halopseudomonas sabulinigri TaxID=472181 RepID=A0A1H1RG73_9GAMM|nr:hypothetical protein SAMN05216271_1716 [Halopseudomonas sabulinigri]
MTRSYQGHYPESPQPQRHAVALPRQTRPRFPLSDPSRSRQLTRLAACAGAVRMFCSGQPHGGDRLMLSQHQSLDTITTMEMYP